MKSVINDTRVPVKLWTDLETVEVGAVAQLRATASLPFVFKHVAVMPDVHLGVGATVGSVVATKNAICPACVGVDIGCGMMAVKTKLPHGPVMDKLKEIRHSIERSIPVGFNANTKISDRVMTWDGWAKMPGVKTDPNITKKPMYQMGTLGGGNHFIEICLDTENNVWVMLHSGSRNIGKTIAERYIDRAKRICEQYFVPLPNKDLAYLVEGTEEFRQYLYAVSWAQSYAEQNRAEMMTLVLKDLAYAINGNGEPLERVIEVNCHHNYVAREHHFGENVMVTRKGAVRARLGDMGIIPGSMGAKSFIVRGRGNPDSFDSCSHGAGRKMSRTKAKQTFTVDDLATQTAGVECRKDDGVVDEIPGAYKDIDAVMENQSDLVEIIATLKQVVCVKG